MAIVSAYDGVLYADDNHFSALLDANEDVIFQVIDAIHAQELQFQEALMASMITAQMTNNVSLSMPEPGPEPFVIVNETGESSLSFCEICNERKENDQMFRNESRVHSFCLDCISTHVVAMINNGKNIVTCPGSNCKCVLELDMCRPVLSKEVLDLWNEALCKELVVASLKLYCPFDNCSAMLVNNNEGEDIRESECPVCHRLFCVQCSVPWHSGVECEDYQRGREDLMESKLAEENECEGSLQCKTEGCPQIACSKELHTEMSSKKGSAEPFIAGTSNNPTSEGGNVVEVPSAIVKQMSDSVADTSLSSAKDDGKLEVHAKKSNIRAESSAEKFRNAMPSHTSNSKKPVSKGYIRPQFTGRGNWKGNKYMVPKPVNSPPLERGSNCQSMTAFPSKGPEDGQVKVEGYIEVNNNESATAAVSDADDNSDGLNETDEELLSDDFDSDTSQKSHETRKNNRWFNKFFENLNNLTIEEINEPTRKWHCPACQGGPGAIRWYQGLQPLMTHAKTKGKKRVKLHQELAELLDEELHRRRTPVTPVVEVLAKWKALRDENKDHEIVWPPMVVIMNTCLKQDVNHKWTGMGNQELLDYFSSYSPVKAQHSYGPQGHRGMSVLIFESSARGYLEAEHLHVHFAEERRGKSAWYHCPVLFPSVGERQLYGYMATKEDLDNFNQHSKGKSKLKYEMRSYQEMVMNQVKQMSEDNKQLIWLKNRFVQEQSHAEALQESLRTVTEKLQMRTEEIRIVRQKTKLQHENNKEELDFLEQFFKDQLKTILKEARNVEDENLQAEQNENTKQSNTKEYGCSAKSMNFQEGKILRQRRTS